MSVTWGCLESLGGIYQLPDIMAGFRGATHFEDDIS